MKRNELRKVIKEVLQEDHLETKEEQIKYIIDNVSNCPEEKIKKIYEYIEKCLE
jgi:hypothetical protein